ncbi:FAD/NAD(P)-binding domain-containing protein [Mycena olivaceomarginata]|nr:FAD/NAD(P)-binding domain-containing protein [Mycena olivaceomarginata]
MSGPLPSSIEVCIVGAGPSGLACALGLAARKIPFVIVDALEAGHNSSRAVVMHASALEALETVHPRLADQLVSAGIQSKSFTTIDLHEQLVFRLRLTELAAYTKYAFALLIPQHAAEYHMREYMLGGGNSIHWNKRVIGVTEAADGAQYELRFESGEALTARYLVAADGSKSFLRTFAGIPFRDPYTKKAAEPGKNDLSFVVADVVFASPLPANVPRDGPQVMVGAGGMVLTAPILGEDSAGGSVQNDNLFRLYLGVPDTPPRAPDAPYLQAILNARGPGSHLKTTAIVESSRYRTRPALGGPIPYILLVGDAAHKHGPGGGQGMNMGICDGIELAQAIEEHRKCAVDAEKAGTYKAVQIMDAYSTRRRAVAAQVINMVDRITEVEKGGQGWGAYLRLKYLWALFKVPFMNGVFAWQLSGLGHAKKP